MKHVECGYQVFVSAAPLCIATWSVSSLSKAEVHRALYATHHEGLDDPRNEAEGLDRASCPRTSSTSLSSRPAPASGVRAAGRAPGARA